MAKKDKTETDPRLQFFPGRRSPDWKPEHDGDSVKQMKLEEERVN